MNENRDDLLVFQTEDGESVELLILEETSVNGNHYILVTDAQEQEEEAYIFRDVSPADAQEAVYEPVEDEAELEALGKIFTELLEDTEVVY